MKIPWLNVKIPWLLQNVSLPRRTYGTIRLSRCAAGNKKTGGFVTETFRVSITNPRGFFY